MPTPNPNAVPVNLQPGYAPDRSGLAESAAQLQGQELAPRAPARYEPPDNDGAGPSFYADNDYIDPYTQPEFYENLPNQTPPPGWEEQAFAGPQVDPSQFPNYEKLSGIEKAIMNATAGWKNTPWGQAADKFSQNPIVQTIGKGLEPVLGAFDVGAEALERTVGFGTQAAEAFSGGDQTWRDFKNNLTSAWYAGSLSADMTRTLSHTGDVDSVGDFIKGFKFDEDLPGNAGLIRARQRIADVVAQGGTYRDGLAVARAEYMDSLGALAFRAQIHDTAFHLLADPLNILLPMIKPVQWTQTARTKLLNMADPEGLGVIAQNVAKAEEAMKLAQAGGNAADVTKAQTALDLARQVEQDYKVARKLSWGEQMMTRLFGGPESLVKFQDTELKGLARVLTPFQLTPQAKAQEYFGNVLDNFLNYLVNPNVGRAGEIDFSGLARDIQRIQDGALDPRIAHMIVTPEGRATRTALEGMAGVANGIATQRQIVANVERPLFDLVKDALGVSPTALMKRIEAGEVQAILQQFGTKLQANPELVQRLQSIAGRAGIAPDALLTADQFGSRMATLNVGGAPVYDDQLMLLELANQMGESVAKRAITMFGLKERGAVQAFTDALKSAESLAYLRLNPTYPIRNKINNVITMIARGAFGFMGDDAIKNYWKLRGGEPARLFSGLGPAEVAAKLVAGDEVHALAQASARGAQTIADVTKGSGVARKFEDWMSKLGDGADKVIGKLGFGGQVAANNEARAGALAMTVGDIQGHRIFGKPGGGIIAHARDIMNPDIARTIGDDIIRQLEGVASSARTPAQIDDALAAKNWKLGVDNLIERAEGNLGGLSLDDIMGPEFRMSVTTDLQKAVDAGPRAVEDFFTQLYARSETQIRDLTDVQMRDLALEIQNKVTAEGPKAGVDLYNQAIDTLRASESSHAMRMAELAEAARSAKPKQSHALWTHIKARESSFFDNTWKRMETITDGIAKAAKQAGFNGAPITDAFKSWRKTWGDFYAFRDKNLNQFWDAIQKGETPKVSWDELTRLNNERYALALDMEKAATRKLDRSVGGLLPEGPQRDVFLAWREKMLALRETDAKLVQEFREDILPKVRGTQARYQAYLEHNKERRALVSAAWQEELNGRQALKGNPRAQAQYQYVIAQSKEELQNGYAIWDKVQAGQPLTADETTAWQRLVETFAEPDEIQRLRQMDAGQLSTLQSNRDKLFLEANDLGIETASATGKPSYNRLLNTLNKHRPPEIGAFSFEELRAGLTDQRLAEARYSLALRTWEPDPLRRTIRENALYLQRQLGDFEGPAMIRKDAADAGVSYTRLGSGRPEWLQEIARETNYTYNELNKVLADIAVGKPRRGEAAKVVEDALLKASQQDINPITGVAKGEGELLRPPTLDDFLPDVSDAQRLADERLDLERDIFGRYVEGSFEQAYGQATDAATMPSIPSLEDVGIKPEYYLSQLADESFQQHGQFALDALKNETLAAMKEPPLNFEGLNALQQAEVRRYINHAKAALPDVNAASLRFAQWKRDSALLNYSRRTNFDAWLGTMAPYSFWSTHSGWNWALHSIDRPAMLSTYYKMNKWLRESYNPQPGAPTRFKGQLRVRLPFLPEWMGDQFIDPFAVALPFDNWQNPFEQMEGQEMRDMGTARRKLDELLDSGEISQQDYDEAQASQEGATWERALALAQQDDKENRYDAFDFVTAFANPHAPLLWAFNKLRGKTDPTGGNTFLPITRTISAASQALRISPLTRPYIPPGGWNIEAGLRQALGLHPMLDKWQDYRIDRELANMVADGEISVDEAKRAMIERTGEAYDRARDREGYQRSLTTGAGFLGLPLRAYPEGEEHLRNLADDYARAWAAYDKGDGSVLDKFNEQYPEYEARLGLYKQPDERIRDYLIDGLWDKWNGLTSLHKRQISEQLGPLFERAFLDKELRDYESISDATLGTWLKLIGGNPPGTLQTSRNDVPPLDLAPMEVAQSVQEFYDSRKLYFPDYRELQDQYFNLPEKGSERKAFRNANPQLVSYWDWRREWLDQNPEAAVYLTDNSSSGKDTTSGGGGGQSYSYSTPAASQGYDNFRYYPTGDELRALVGDEAYGLLGDMAMGDPLPEVAQSYIQPAIEQYGLSAEQLAQISVGGNPDTANDGYWFDNRLGKWRSGPEDANGPVVQAWFDNRINQWRLGYEDANPPGQILGAP